MKIFRFCLQLVMAGLATFGAGIMWYMIPKDLVFQMIGGVVLIVVVLNMWKETYVMFAPDLPVLIQEGMILCDICGNKRCPHASDHRLECTDSNEPGQKG